jgi:signal transduction histidine kinase
MPDMNDMTTLLNTPASHANWSKAQLSSIYPELLSLLVDDSPLSAMLSKLVQLLRKSRGPSTRAAIFIHEPESQALRFSASVGIEPGYTKAVDGFPVEGCKPACGSAVFYGRDVLVEDVYEDPKWQPFLHLCTEFDFRACWSFVLVASSGECLGTLALYHADRCLPTAADAEQVKYFAKTAALLVERHLKQDTQNKDLRELEEHLRSSTGTDTALSVLAHELRNPLSAVRNAVKALQFGGDQPKLREKALAILDRQTRQMEWLVEDLIDADRATRNMLQLKTENHNLYDILQFAIESVQGQFETKQQKLEFEDWSNREIRVRADYRRLAQVFGNLLGNASKFSPSQCAVDISVVADEKTVTVSIRDAGLGLRPEDTTRIFQMFEQVDNGRREGLGIGLALVQRLTELHGGVVAATSRGLGQGTIFTIALPIALHSTRASID